MSRRSQRSNLGILLLLSELYRYGFHRIPPVTLATIAGQVALYLDFFQIPNVRTNLDVCVSAISVWYKQDWKRLFLSPFFHGDDFHLYYNMTSYLIKGSSLEKRWGSKYFLYVIAIFSILTSLTYVGLAFLAEHFLADSNYLTQCAVGFSGVIFALKVVTTHYLPPNANILSFIFIPIPARYACWAELVLIQLLTPNASFLGHLAGIIVGYLYIQGPLKYIMDTFYLFDSNNSQTYRSRNTYDYPRTYGSGTSGYSPNEYTGGLSEEEQLSQLLRQQSAAGDSGHNGVTRPSAPPYPTPGYMPSPEEIRNRRADRWL